MGKEIDLMKNYPRTKRDIKQRGKEKTNKDRNSTRIWKNFFNGDRRNDYGYASKIGEKFLERYSDLLP